MRIVSNSVEETRAAGADLARKAGPGDVLALVGALGTGKTEFVRGFVASLAPGAVVRSPTFSLVNSYATPVFAIHHFDFYRIVKISELTEIGFEEYLWGGGVCLIEWADMFPQALPPHSRMIRFSDGEHGGRVIDIEGEV
jgi:tRNA threonylcarbamoyladenosine biosynthesis protein TsaE